MGKAEQNHARKELVAVREQLRPLLEQLRTGGKLGEHLAPNKRLSPTTVLELAQRTRELLECVVQIHHADLHNSAWLLLLHIRYYLPAAGVPESPEFEELLWSKHPER